MNGDSFLRNCGAVLEVEYNEKNLVLSTELIMYLANVEFVKLMFQVSTLCQSKVSSLSGSKNLKC